MSYVWEQRKLGDTVQITMGQSPDGTTYSDIPSNYILIQGNADLQNGWVVPKIWTSQMTKKADAGDLIMSVRAPAGAMGKTAYNAVIGRGVAAIKGNEFIYQLLVKMDSEGFWKSLSCGSTFGSLNTHNIKNADILIPDIVEQTEIGEYFSNLDHLITLHQRKCDEIKKLKKYMLQNMFPQNDEKAPKIRFNGFTDDWEQRKLNEICNYKSSSLTVADRTEQGKFPLYDANGQIGMVDSFYMQEDYITVIKDGAGVGRIRRLPKNTAFIGTMGALTSKNSELNFLYYLLEKKDLSKQYTGSTIPHIYFKDYGRNDVLVSDIKEQQKIGLYFDQLDHLITLHQWECIVCTKIKVNTSIQCKFIKIGVKLQKCILLSIILLFEPRNIRFVFYVNILLRFIKVIELEVELIFVIIDGTIMLYLKIRCLYLNIFYTFIFKINK